MVQKESKIIMIGLLRKVELVTFKLIKYTPLGRNLAKGYSFIIVLYIDLKKRKITISIEFKIKKSVEYLGYQLKKSKNKAGHQ